MGTGHKPIVVFCATPEPTGGGVQAVAQGLVRHARARGRSVIEAWTDCIEGEVAWRWRLETGGEGRLSAPLRAMRDLLALARQIATTRPAAINVHFIRGEVLYFALLRFLFGFRLVLSFHGVDLPPQNAAMRWILPFYLRRADIVTVVSETLRREAVKLGRPRRIVVIENGVDCSFWSPGAIRDGRPLVVAAGRLEPVKGFDTLIEAFASAAPADVQLVIAGEGAELHRLEKQAKAMGVWDRVVFPGHLSPEELRDLYRRGSVFALSSRSEGMPLVLIEAMACGLPIVATRVGDVPAIVEPEFGELVEPEDPRALSAALCRALDPSFARRAEPIARRRAERFSASRTFDRYLEELEG